MLVFIRQVSSIVLSLLFDALPVPLRRARCPPDRRDFRHDPGSLLRRGRRPAWRPSLCRGLRCPAWRPPLRRGLQCGLCPRHGFGRRFVTIVK